MELEKCHLWNGSVFSSQFSSYFSYFFSARIQYFPSNKDLSTWFPLILLIFVISLQFQLLMLLLLWPLELLLFYWRFVSKCQQQRMSTTKITATKRSWSFDVDCAVVSSFPLYPSPLFFWISLVLFLSLEQIKCLLKKLQTCIAAWKFQMCISGATLLFGCFVTKNLLQSRLRPDTNTFKNVPTYVSRLVATPQMGVKHIYLSGNSVDRSLVHCHLHWDHGAYGVLNL